MCNQSYELASSTASWEYLADNKQHAHSKSIAVLKNTAHRERYMNGIFDKKEKILDYKILDNKEKYIVGAGLAPP